MCQQEIRRRCNVISHHRTFFAAKYQQSNSCKTAVVIKGRRHYTLFKIGSNTNEGDLASTSLLHMTLFFGPL